MNIGPVLKSLRLEKFPKPHYNQGDVAALIGIKQSFLSQIEAGKKEPRAEVLKKICDTYKTPVAIVIWRATEVKDVAEGKKKAFASIKKSVDNLINEFF